MTDEAKALVDRLRGGWNGWTTLTESEAADRIEALEAEVERLREQLRLANIDALSEPAENERLRLDVEAQEALQVSAYHAGLRAGWNFGVSDDNASMQAALANTDHIKELRRIREARAALGEKQ